MDDLGDVRSAMYYNSESFNNLIWFIEYCLILKIDAKKHLKLYKNDV